MEWRLRLRTGTLSIELDQLKCRAFPTPESPLEVNDRYGNAMETKHVGSEKGHVTGACTRKSYMEYTKPLKMLTRHDASLDILCRR